jgi:hypothetical protein
MREAAFFSGREAFLAAASREDAGGHVGRGLVFAHSAVILKSF